MKPQHILPLAIASLAFAGNSAQAADDNNAREHKLSVSLTLRYEGDYNYDEKNNGNFKQSQKIETSKVSNKELLQAFVGEGVINDIKGWSIVLVTDDNANIVGTFLTRKNTTPINISEFFYGDVGPSISGFDGKYTASKDKYTSKNQVQALGIVGIDVDGFAAEAQGLFESTSDYTDEPGTETDFVKKADFTSMVGDFEDDNEEVEGLVTGSVKAGNGKKITLSNYNPPA